MNKTMHDVSSLCGLRCLLRGEQCFMVQRLNVLPIWSGLFCPAHMCSKRCQAPLAFLACQLLVGKAHEMRCSTCRHVTWWIWDATSDDWIPAAHGYQMRAWMEPGVGCICNTTEAHFGVQ